VRLRRASIVVYVLLLAGCNNEMLSGCDNMKKQPYAEPLAPSTFFDDNGSARPLVPGTVARGQLEEQRLIDMGGRDLDTVEELPFPLSREVLDRGEERFGIYCTPCHDAVGDGRGIVVQRGFTPPPSLHSPRLREIPLGHFVKVMTDGFGAMYSYADRITPRDRWAIAAYIRTLQLSQAATLDDVPADERSRLQEAPR